MDRTIVIVLCKLLEAGEIKRVGVTLEQFIIFSCI